MKKYRSEEEWRTLFAEQEKSGLNVRQFCLQQGLNTNVFYRKKKDLSKKSGFCRLPVHLVGRNQLEISIGNVRIGVGPGFDKQDLVSVLCCVREVFDALL